MSKTYHNKRDRLAGLEPGGRVHHEHSHHGGKTCPHCGKAAKGGQRKRERVALLGAMTDIMDLTEDDHIAATLSRAQLNALPRLVSNLIDSMDELDGLDAIDWAYPYES